MLSSHDHNHALQDIRESNRTAWFRAFVYVSYVHPRRWLQMLCGLPSEVTILPPVDEMRWVAVLTLFSRDGLGKFARWNPSDSFTDVDVPDHRSFMLVVQREMKALLRKINDKRISNELDTFLTKERRQSSVTRFVDLHSKKNLHAGINHQCGGKKDDKSAGSPRSHV